MRERTHVVVGESNVLQSHRYNQPDVTEKLNQQDQRSLDLMNEAGRFTIPLLIIVDEEKGQFGLGSAVLLRWQGVRIGSTAEHALSENPKALVWDMPAHDYRVRTSDVADFALQAQPLYRDPAIDLLLLDARSLCHVLALGKTDYDLTKSAGVTAATLSTNPLPFGFIYGYLGPATGAVKVGGLWLFDPPPYQARGQLTIVENDRIIARFEEHRVVSRNVDAYSQLADLQIEGKSRNLKGTSGCGLWVSTPQGLVLVGLLRGPANGEIGDPDIVFTPIWVILRELAQRWKVPS